uniref:uncharacterized protein LOC120333830 isoform X2 n=1 Tax=Styela clava TaxID=7725 RepID=UPI0019399692|nr:uncharacterized protein LOC120333830 isoform X2 [Styela clava]
MHARRKMTFEKLQFRVLQEEDYDVVWDLVLKEFIPREPSFVPLKLTDEDCNDLFRNSVKEGISHRSSIGVFDKDTGELIGINLTALGKKRGPISVTGSGKSSKKEQQIGRLVSILLGGGSPNAPEVALGTRNYMQSFMLCSKSTHANIGIGTELYKRTDAIARKEGCKKRFTYCTNAFTFKICDKFGYESLKDIYYKDYVDPVSGGKILESIPPPHIKISLMVLRRNQRSCVICIFKYGQHCYPAYAI